MASTSEPKALDKSKPAAPAAQAEDAQASRGWLSWVVGWLLVPGTVVGVIFGGGVILGAHRHDGWFARTVVWLVDLF